MEWLDARAMLEGEPAPRVDEDLQRATDRRWRFTATSVLELRPMAQGRELEIALFGCSEGQRAGARRTMDRLELLRKLRR